MGRSSYLSHSTFRLPVFVQVEGEGHSRSGLQKLSALLREFDGHYFTDSRDSEECLVADDLDEHIRLYHLGLKVDDVGFPIDVEREGPPRNAIEFWDTAESEHNRLREVVGNFRDAERAGVRVRSGEVHVEHASLRIVHSLSSLRQSTAFLKGDLKGWNGIDHLPVTGRTE